METDVAPSGAANASIIATTTTPSTPEDALPDGNATCTAQDDTACDDAAGSVMDDSEDAGEAEQPFVQVPTKQHRANCQIETAAFGDEKTPLRTRLHRLKECLAGVANPLRTPSVRHMLQEDGSSVPFFVFEIGEHSEREALTKMAITSPDGSASWPFLLLSEDQQKAEVSRTIDIRSLSFDTKEHQIVAALTKYGAIERVVMGFNLIKSMATAHVVFTTAEAVNDMIKREITCVTVGQDTGMVARLGDTRPAIDHKLTLKLTHLPFGCTPRDVAEALADFRYFGVTMPLDPNTKRRKMEAFVYFAHSQDQKEIRKGNFQFGTDTKDEKTTAWAEPNTSTCYGCGAVGHRSNKCEIVSEQQSIRQLRKKNANLISPSKQPSKAPVQHRAGQPLTKAQITAAKGKGKATSPPPVSVWTTGKASALFANASTSNSNHAGPSRQGPQVQQHAPALGKVAATAIPSQQPQPAWKAAHDAMNLQVRQATARLDKKIDEWQQQMQTQFQQMDHRLDRMEQMCRTYFAQATPVRSLPPASVSAGKIVDIANETTKNAAELLQTLAQERAEKEEQRKALVAMQQELISVNNTAALQRDFIERNKEFANKQSAQLSQLSQVSHVSNTPQSQQGVSPMPQMSGSQILYQTIPWTFPGTSSFPSVPSPPDFSSQGGSSQPTEPFAPMYSQHSEYEDSVHYSPPAPSGDRDTTDYSQTQSQGQQNTAVSFNES
jgi:hypothetical protein